MTEARPAAALPLARRVLPWVLGQHRAGRRVLGISGPQGCGKSTLVANLVDLLRSEGLTAAAVSIDDFYLTRAGQLQLATAHATNPYLEHRGYPGTHDVALGATTLDALRALGAGESCEVPSYDKSAHGGRGDRRSRGTRVVGPLDLVLIEGWMLGFAAVSEVAEPSMATVNELLRAYEAWSARIDALVVLETDDPENVVRWRVDAEERRAARGEPALDRPAVLDYVRRFLPAYALYGDKVKRGRWSPDRQLVLRLTADRSLLD